LAAWSCLVPRMVRVERITADVAAFGEDCFALPLAICFMIMTRRAQRLQRIEVRIWRAAGLDWDDVVDRDRRLDAPLFETYLAQRVRCQLKPAYPLPALRGVRPNCHRR